MTIDHLLVIGFGGPPRPEDVQPFLEQVTRGLDIPDGRLDEVAHHYAAVGGFSKYNEDTARLVDALRQRLQVCGIQLPVFLGMRNWHPFLRDTLADISRQGLRQGLGVILAPHRSFSSFERYIRNVEEAKAAAAAPHIVYEYLRSWHDHPRFIQAQADRIQQVLEGLTPDARGTAVLVFSAHSIPVEMARQCHYAEEFRRSSELIAHSLGRASWRLAYQSRSGRPSHPWLEPDVAAVIHELHGQGARHIVVVPVGFLCENAEVLFDLDLEARAEAEGLGFGYSRAPTVTEHPQFVEMFRELIQERVGGRAGPVCVAGQGRGGMDEV